MSIKCERPETAVTSIGAEALVWMLLAVCGTAGLWLASGWPMGQFGRPGPGAFATIIMGLLTGLACLRLAVCLQGYRLSQSLRSTHTDQTVLSLLAAPAVFAVLIEPAGFILAALVCTGLVAMAGGARPLRAALIALVLTVMIFLLFRFGLSVPLDWRGSWMR